jgi:hypothetical protein
VINVQGLGAAQDHASAQETDAGDHALDDPAGRIGQVAGRHDQYCGAQRHQRMRADSRRLAVDVAVEADCAAEHDGRRHARQGVEIEVHRLAVKPLLLVGGGQTSSRKPQPVCEPLLTEW